MTKNKNYSNKKHVVYCPYCGKETELVDSKEIYGNRSYGWAYLCRDCWAYVGCHNKTKIPLGFPANEETRNWRMKAHAMFDPLWRLDYGNNIMSKSDRRKLLYKKVSELMNLDPNLTHIAMFNVEQCQKLISLILNGEISRECLK